MTVLDDNAVQSALADLPGWSGDSSALTRKVEALDYKIGLLIVDDIARAADEIDHHPEININYTTLTFTLTTHSENGVTEKDVELAKRIDAVFKAVGATRDVA